MMAGDDNKRTAERKTVKKPVEFFVDADIIQAESVDLSSTGIRMTTQHPIRIRMRIYDDDGGFREQVAELVWASKEAPLTSYGFEFGPDPEAE